MKYIVLTSVVLLTACNGVSNRDAMLEALRECEKLSQASCSFMAIPNQSADEVRAVANKYIKSN